MLSADYPLSISWALQSLTCSLFLTSFLLSLPFPACQMVASSRLFTFLRADRIEPQIGNSPPSCNLRSNPHETHEAHETRHTRPKKTRLGRHRIFGNMANAARRGGRGGITSRGRRLRHAAAAANASSSRLLGAAAVRAARAARSASRQQQQPPLGGDLGSGSNDIGGDPPAGPATRYRIVWVPLVRRPRQPQRLLPQARHQRLWGGLVRLFTGRQAGMGPEEDEEVEDGAGARPRGSGRVMIALCVPVPP